MILVYTEHSNGEFKKSALEALTFGVQMAEATGLQCAALVLGKTDNASALSEYGVNEVYQVESGPFDFFDSQCYTQAIANAASKLGAKWVLMSHTAQGKALVGRLAVRLKRASIPGVSAVEKSADGSAAFVRTVYSGKAIGRYKAPGAEGVVSVMVNALPPKKVGGQAEVKPLELEMAPSKISLVARDEVKGEVPLTEAELVVSAGRGMKGPENWGIVEELAGELGAATACSRPVADADWRPHHEHVGQTGIAIRPNLYIAIGISGAIQHLAGVNNSKVIVVINKDPEAPFFKAADYGVVGDLFEVVPRLTQAIKDYKSN